MVVVTSFLVIIVLGLVLLFKINALALSLLLNITVITLSSLQVGRKSRRNYSLLVGGG